MSTRPSFEPKILHRDYSQVGPTSYAHSTRPNYQRNLYTDNHFDVQISPWSGRWSLSGLQGNLCGLLYHSLKQTKTNS